MSEGVKDHEIVSIYPLTDAQREELLSVQRECVFNWATKDSWPVGVIMSYVWAKGSVWLTAGEHRHRIAAIRRNPKVSVVVTSTGTRLGPAKTITIKGIAKLHEDLETKKWFYHALAYQNPDEGAAAAFETRLDSPLRIVIEVKPEKWITFDGIKFGADTAGVLKPEDRGPMLSSDSRRLPDLLKSKGME